MIAAACGALLVSFVAALAALAALPALAAPAQRDPSAQKIDLRGNRVFPDEVYLTLIAWDRGSNVGDEPQPIPKQQADALAERLESFLRQSGYELAAVRACLADDTVVFDIDEGQLERVVLRGGATARMLQYKALLDIPHQIFNRPSLERQLAHLERLHKIEARMRLVTTRTVDHLGPQFDTSDLPADWTGLAPDDQDPDGSKEATSTPPTAPTTPSSNPDDPHPRYELDIFIGRPDWNTGLGVHIGSGSVDGLRLGVSWADPSLLFATDRWRVRSDVAVAPMRDLSTHETYAGFSRFVADVRWYTPALVKWFRPYLWIYSDLVIRQRADLDLNRYKWWRSGALVNVGYEPAAGRLFALGVGWESRRLFDVDPLPSSTVADTTMPPGFHSRGVAALAADLTFNTDEIRVDRRHELLIDIRGYLSNAYGSGTALWDAQLDYQKVFAFGWHDLWITSKGFTVFGDVGYVDERPVSSFTRGLFRDVWVRRGAGTALEFRYSLMRDICKVSVFSDIAMFEDPSRTTGHGTARAAGGIGIGLHALVLDIAQLDFYYAYGLTTGDARRDGAFSARLAKAF